MTPEVVKPTELTACPDGRQDSRTRQLAQSYFGVVITAHLRHGDLWALKNRLGSGKACAAAIGVAKIEFSRWLNLKSFPKYPKSNSRYAKRRHQIEKRFLDLTGKLLEELWPEQLRDAIRNGTIAPSVEVSKSIDLAQLVAAQEARSICPHPIESLIASEARETINDVLDGMDDRWRLVIETRHGLNGNHFHTFAEIAEEIGTTHQRAQQLHESALKEFADDFHETYGDELDDIL